MLKHVSTRWLSIGRCLDRLLQNWVPLQDYFKKEKEEMKASRQSQYAKSKVKAISEGLLSPSAQLYTLFLKYMYTTTIFEPFLTSFQSEAQKINDLHRSISRLVHDVLLKFVKPAAMTCKLVTDIDFTSSYNHKDDAELVIGSAVREFIKNKEKNHLTSERLKEFYSSVKDFYARTAAYLLKNLPFQDLLLTDLSITQPESLQADGSLIKLQRLLERYPVLLQGSSADLVTEEFCHLQTKQVASP